ncbi:hypothetical protein GXP67_33270 [Rhodocytophaga rosea]|uniref:Uncharacterized protein n=1 Tax=Rhodocytophaga rosea TaxID=2704465 RepID=A0A6C0GSR9_9BACT|nr:hypothetical protein [Rhodocytophaga rosea]QHT71179.1 hypothetical protein GXP67_33270 [Rhodocytophaga rosea]
MTNDFYPGMKVYLNGEYGIVLQDCWELDEVYDIDVNGVKHKRTDSKMYGLIRWDTNAEFDSEDHRGLFGSFIQMGGKEVDQSYQFKFINEDGTLKK